MKASKVGLLILILGFGGTVETAWQVRNHFGVGPWDWRVLTGGKFSGPSYSFEATESQVVPEGTPIEVENAFGGVRAVQGAPGEVRIVLRKVVFRRNEEEAGAFAARVLLKRDLEAGALRISTNRREVEATADGRGVGFETHLEITLPPGTRLKVQNDHGETSVADVAEARVWGSYDSVRVERVAGIAEVSSKHGDVTVAGVGGALSLTARHGAVEIRQVKGRATLIVEHGDVSANEVGGLDLNLRHGALTADGILGDLEVAGEHAGVHAVAVTGRAVVETGYQDITVERVGGDVRLVSKHGDVRAADVAGAVYAEARFDAMLAAGAVDEARALLSRSLDPALPAMKALGAAELMAHLRGEMTLAEAVLLAKRNTRRFVKRQLTWFRNQTPGWMRALDARSAVEMLASNKAVASLGP